MTKWYIIITNDNKVKVEKYFSKFDSYNIKHSNNIKSYHIIDALNYDDALEKGRRLI